MAAKLLLLFVLGAAIRLYLLITPGKLSWIFHGVGVSTPQNSWKRVTEGIYLYRKGLNPYSGGIFHETPFVLVVFDFVTRNSEAFVPYIFVLCDLLTAFTLLKLTRHFARNTLVDQSKNVASYASDCSNLLLKAVDLKRLPSTVAVLYLFHPYGIASCCGMTTTVFANLVISLSIYFATLGKPIPMSAFLSLASYQGFYPAMLVLPLSKYVAQMALVCVLEFGGLFTLSWLGQMAWEVDLNCQSLKQSETNPGFKIWMSMSVTFIFHAFFTAVLLLASYSLLGSWNYLEGVHGFILYAEDLTPNIGLFWYFFTEMFDHFRDFFICAFQINAFIYVLPLMFKFRDDSMFVAFILLVLMSIFKSYQSVGDIALYMSLLPVWSHLYRFMRQPFVIGCIFLACSVLGPVLYHMWLYAGSANANFFFGTTLALNVAQIFLVTDLLFAHIKRDYHLVNGQDLTVDGKTRKLVLE